MAKSKSPAMRISLPVIEDRSSTSLRNSPAVVPHDPQTILSPLMALIVANLLASTEPRRRQALRLQNALPLGDRLAGKLFFRNEFPMTVVDHGINHCSAPTWRNFNL